MAGPTKRKRKAVGKTPKYAFSRESPPVKGPVLPPPEPKQKSSRADISAVHDTAKEQKKGEYVKAYDAMSDEEKSEFNSIRKAKCMKHRSYRLKKKACRGKNKAVVSETYSRKCAPVPVIGSVNYQPPKAKQPVPVVEHKVHDPGFDYRSGEGLTVNRGYKGPPPEQYVATSRDSGDLKPRNTTPTKFIPKNHNGNKAKRKEYYRQLAEKRKADFKKAQELKAAAA